MSDAPSFEMFDLHGYLLCPLGIDTLARRGMFPTNITYEVDSNKPIFNWDNPTSLLFNKHFKKKYCKWFNDIKNRYEMMSNLTDSQIVDLIAAIQKTIKEESGSE